MSQLKMRHLSINPSKSHAISIELIPKKKKLYTITSPQFTLNGHQIPQVHTINFFKYLGLQLSDSGFVYPSSSSVNTELEKFFKNQMPRLIARLQHFNISSKLLSDVNRKIRHFVRKTLHLFAHSSNAIFYAPLKQGGLGIFNFKLMIPIIIMRRMENVANSSPKLERVLQDATSLVESIKNLIKAPLNTSKEIKQHFSRELDAGYSGNGMGQVRNDRSTTPSSRIPQNIGMVKTT